MTNKRNNQGIIFNSPQELSARIIFILSKFEDKCIGIQELISLDYLLLHIKDLNPKLTSFHPDIPLRSGEIIIKRQIITQAIDLLLGRELIRRNYQNEGVSYKITPLGLKFKNILTSSYARKLESYSDILYDEVSKIGLGNTLKYVNENYTQWGSEFVSDSVLQENIDL